MEIDDEPFFDPPALAFTQLTVDIGAMEDFVALLQAEIDQNLAPYSQEIIEDHWYGQPIARRSASVPEQAFRYGYVDAVDTSIQGLRSYLHATKVLLRAVELVADRYRYADGMAVAQQIDVQGAMSLAHQEIAAQSALELPKEL